jgi:NIPSNAP
MPKVHLLFALAVACSAAAVTASAQSPSIAKGSRLFEMRTYVAAPGKFEELHARFRQHTNKLFVKHGMTIVGYWVPTEKGRRARRRGRLSLPARPGSRRRGLRRSTGS